MCLLNQFIENMFTALTGMHSVDHNIIRVHTRKLQQLGDLSFPLSTKSWFRFIDKNCLENKSSIFSCHMCQNELQEKSKQWPLNIENIVIKEGNAIIYLSRKNVFNVVIKTVMEQTNNFGSENVNSNKSVYIPHSTIDFTKAHLTELKVHLLEQVTTNILLFTKHSICRNTVENNRNLLALSLASHENSERNASHIKCGPVLNEHGSKDLSTTAEQLYNQRTVDMRLMAEHKYGVRTTLLPGWKEFFQKLGEAAVTIHLLQNKPQHTTVVKLNDPASASIKGASFILYNCARLATLLKEFDKKVGANIYPTLSALEEIEFNLLVEPEEWELLFVYILRFPIVIKSCINQIDNSQVSPHFLIAHLSGLASTFSVYYRRVRILTEPREHLYPVLHQRIYLLKSLQCVFNNALRLLGIEPVKQM